MLYGRVKSAMSLNNLLRENVRHRPERRLFPDTGDEPPCEWQKVARGLIWVLLVWTVACSGASPAGSEDGVPTFGPCNRQPNYISEVTLNRWRSFPLAYFFDSASFSPDFVDQYRETIGAGILRWADATGTDLGTIVQVNQRERADLVVTFRNVVPPDISVRAFHATGTPFLAGGEIAFNRADLAPREERVREGLIDRDLFFEVIGALAAHEMGHILGIIGHPSDDDVLMWNVLVAFPATADVNTLVHAYCRP
jgi:hypothetical protein